jgi:hypothetical protein
MKTNLSAIVPAPAWDAAPQNSFGPRPRAENNISRRLLLLAATVVLGSLTVSAQENAAPPTNPPAQSPATNPAAVATPAAAPGAPEQATAAPAAATPAEAMTMGSSTNGLQLNFRNAPIDLVLNYLSDAAGFIIVSDTTLRGSVTVRGQNLTKDEAVNLVNSELNKNGYAAIRSGTRTLRIMDKNAAKSGNNPVKILTENESIPDNDEMVTWIIPIRFVEAGQLISDISPFVSSGATIIANQAGNSIVVTDTQANIRHLVEIIKAIDSSAEDVTEVKVFHLQYADPTEMATLLSGLFPDQTGAQSPFRVAGGRGGGGRGGFGGGGFGGGGFGGGGFGGRGGGFGGGGFNPFAAAFAAGANQGTGSGQNDRIKKRNQVIAVADARTSSVVVTATRDLMEQISEMVDQLDHPGKRQDVAVIAMPNSNPQAVLQVLQDTFGASNTRNNRNTQIDPFANRIQQNQNSSTSLGTGLGSSSVRRGSTGGAGGFGGF